MILLKVVHLYGAYNTGNQGKEWITFEKASKKPEHPLWLMRTNLELLVLLTRRSAPPSTTRGRFEPSPIIPLFYYPSMKRWNEGTRILLIELSRSSHVAPQAHLGIPEFFMKLLQTNKESQPFFSSAVTPSPFENTSATRTSWAHYRSLPLKPPPIFPQRLG